MKKTLSLILVSAVTLTMLAGCGGKKKTSAKPDGIVKIGLGHITSIAKSKDLGTDATGKEVLPVGQVDTVIAAVAFDKSGKVVKVTIDDAQTKVNFDKALQVTSDTKEPGKTKVELGEKYGLKSASQIKKEWYEQIAELEKWMVGKKVSEIKALKTKVKDEQHTSVPDVPELTSLVTISVEDFIAAVEEAYNNSVEVKGNAVKLGLGHEVSIASSKGLGTDKDGKEVLPQAQVNTVMAATAFDKSGKVVTVIIDNAQTKIAFDKNGKVTADKNSAPKTKVELGDKYGMKSASSIGKEWYQQIAELQKWMAGKSISDIKAMKTKQKDAAHPAVPDVAELTSLVTVSVQDYIAAVSEAYDNAK